MAITATCEVRDDTLLVKSIGCDDSLDDVINYTNFIAENAIHSNIRKILCDERELEYKLSVLDTYKLAEFASQYVQHVARIAIVCNNKYIQSGEFYETVSQNRGLIVRIFTDATEAEIWLNN